MNKNTHPLFLIEDKERYFLSNVGTDLFYTFKHFKKNNLIKRHFESIVNSFIAKHSYSFLSKFICFIFIHFFYKKELFRLIRKSSFVVFFDNVFRENIIFYCNLKKNKKVFLYTWNVLNEEKIKSWSKIVNKSHIVTYSKSESIIFEIPHICSPYVKLNIPKKNDQIYDIYFLGRAKGKRLEYIIDFFDRLEPLGFNNRIDLLIDKENDFECKRNFLNIMEAYMPYYDYLCNVKCSKCLLDLTYPGNNNLTLRTIEALFYNKKLITNNLAIKDEPYYDENNIYIIDFQNFDINDIIKFLKKDMVLVPEKTLSVFSIDSFVESFELLLRKYTTHE